MDVPLLSTKVHVPQRTADQLERPRLRGALERLLAPGGRLLLLSAPAGFGKSTLLGGWSAAGGGATFAWLTLDAEDNDPARFWTYLVFALRQAFPAFGEQALQALRSLPMPPAAGSRSMRPVLTLALNDLAALPGCPVIVLDDFHRVTSPELLEDLSYALEHWPGSARLVVSTRVDPPLPMARLRAAGRLVELRAADLRFSPEESTRFLEAAAGLPLDPAQVRAIEARVEGWIAGLKMAALALRGAADARALIAGLAGDPRFILEYLAEEVLERQEAGIQEFLVRTAVLDRLCAPLCDAVTGREDGEEVLKEVRRRNLFLVPLDDAGRWFRYHPLFADLLRARLQRLHAQQAAELHRRASRWFEAGDLPDEAFRHALAARDEALAAELVVAHSRRLIWSGWSATVQRWLEALPEETVRRDLRLAVSRCWTSCFTNRWLSLKEDLDRTEALLEEGPPQRAAADPQLERRLRGNAAATVAILRAYVAYREDDLAPALELARQAVEGCAGTPPALQGAALVIQGYALRESGRLEEAREAFLRAGPLFLAERNLTAWAISVQQLADILLARGLLREAERTCEEAGRLLRERDGSRLPAASYVLLASAEAAWLRGGLEQAESDWHAASSGGELTGDPEVVVRCTLGRARLLAARGRPEEAFALLDRVEEAARANRSAPLLAEVTARRAALLVQAGRLDELRRWADGPAAQGGGALSAELRGIGRVRALIGLGRHADASELAGRLLQEARSGGRLGRAGTLLALQALAAWRRGEPEEALAALRQALDLAAPEGALRVLLDEGEGLQAPLARLGGRYGRAAAAPGSRAAAVLEFLRRLLAAYAPPAAAPPSEPPPAPLTAREREVLGLLATGCSNRQIADRLFVSLATVKKHVGAVLEKLGAANRTRAVALARRHGLL